MNEPRTEAGRALAGMLTANGQTDPAMLDYILTIEAEAAQPDVEALDVERLARSLPGVMSQEECDDIYEPGTDPLDVPYEWYETPRKLAEAIAREYDALGAADKLGEAMG